MEKKKTKNAELASRRSMYFNLGLVLAMTFVITAFEWKSFGETEIVNVDLVTYLDEDWNIPPTVEIIPKPPKPIIPKVIIEAAEKELLIDLNEIVIDISEIEFPEPESIELPTEEVVPDFIYNAEYMPEFEGGYAAFYKYIGKKMKYPNMARNLGIEGKVILEFVIDQTGKMTKINVLKGIGAGCDEEAIRVLDNAPAWNPGKQRGKPVNVKMVLPITFSLK